MTPEALASEKKYFKIVKKVLEILINDANDNIGAVKADINELKKFIWENQTQYTENELAIALYGVDVDVSRANDRIKQIVRLEKARKSPYFAKLLFDPNGKEKPFPIYIGITTIADDLNFYVFDWRAPIASLFYNYELGPAKYDSPRGEMPGEILEKLQFKIANDKIIRCFNSDVNIDDEYLQEILSTTENDKMKNIVNTIQREQNEIIRNETDRNLIVQGVAGSGKTSVALHRNAYLLYRNLNLTSNNILIFSPNDVFSDYISEVMPDLGEENVLNSTFSDFALAFLKPYSKVESFSEFLERAYSTLNQNDDCLKYKMSAQYQSDLEQYFSDYKSKIYFKKGLIFDRKEISRAELNSLFAKYGKLPLKERLDRVVEAVCDIYRIPARKYKGLVKRTLLESCDISFDFYQIYQKFLEQKGLTKISSGSNRKIRYEDIVGLLYLNCAINGYPSYNHIKQVVIDEVQDYTPFQLELIKKIFAKAAFTILGDVNQTINPYQKYDSLADLAPIYDNHARYIELNKTYRSSEEIIAYSNSILGLNNVCAIRHSNDIPVDIKDVTKRETLPSLKTDIIKMMNSGLKKIAIITKDSKEALKIHRQLVESGMDIQLVELDDSKITNSKIVLPSYLAKGLEFEGVIIYNNPDRPFIEEEKNLYYVICTRAQHKLSIYNEPQQLLLKNNENTL